MGILSFLSSENFITVNRKIAEVVGLEAAVVLGELASEANYWQQNNPEWDGSFFSTVENLEKRTFLSAHSQRLALNRLQEQGWVEVEKRGMPAKRYIRINEDEITRVVNDKSLKILTTGDEKNERQDVKIFDGKKNINKKNIKEDKKEEYSRPTIGLNPFAEIARKEGFELSIKETPYIRKTTREETVTLLYLISASYPQQAKNIKETEPLIKTWTEAFEEHDPVELYRSALLHISTNKYFPTAAEIIGGITKANINNRTSIPSSQHPEEDAEVEKIMDFINID